MKVMTFCLGLFGFLSFSWAAERPVLDAGVVLEPSGEQVSAVISAGKLEVKIKGGEAGYPGLAFKREIGEFFDFSGFGHVRARVTNTGAEEIGLNLRLDNAGDWSQGGPVNTENLALKPGETGDLKVIFGYSYGGKKSFPLNPAKVTQLLLFTGKVKEGASFRVEELVVGGEAGETPPADPESLRLRPEEGRLFPVSQAVDGEKQLLGKNGARGEVVAGEGLKMYFPGEGKAGEVVFRPAEGRWDLREELELRVRVRNVGERALSPVLQVASNGGPTDQVRVEKLAAGESREVLVSFLPEKSWVGEQAGKGEHWYGEKGTGARFSSDAVKGLVVSSAEAGELLLERIEARLPEPKPLPEWLGKKPPVAGEWVRTLDEDFSGESLDEGIWDVYTENYWDKKSAFSKDNVLLGDGLVRLRYERKESHHNDDPQRKKFPFTTGYLGTYGKFVQLYGYFEARMKMPTTPGLWPAFWMMPDRGPGSKIYRQSTKHQGMEFDIMEHLTRWGPTRFNVAMHWDDYGKEHKAVGSDMIYTRPDAEGYVTCGLLWLPGKAVYYYNGEEVARWEHERISRVPSYLLFTLPQGGWDNAPLDEAQLPGDFTIDYVRVWQRKDFMKKD